MDEEPCCEKIIFNVKSLTKHARDDNNQTKKTITLLVKLGLTSPILCLNHNHKTSLT